jgi:glycosyltransferase involved in cell wall biosynthesis
VPCYNEEKNLEKLVKEFKDKVISSKSNVEVVLVNNGSLDNSSKVMEELKKENDFIKIVTVEKNQGYGYGILSGLKETTGDYIGWIHADLQFNPSEILKGIEYLEENEFPDDVFIRGKRTNRPFIDTLFTICMSFYESIILKTRLWDINAQPTLISRKFYEKWNNPPYDFSLDLYAYYNAKKQNQKIYRYKVVQHKREEGNSSWNTGMKSRIKLIRRVLEYSKTLKNRS